MEQNQIEQNELKDVFISHSWEDKIRFVEPLVAAMEAANISCWYDLLQIKAGDSLIERINFGLTHSKIILLFLSENFLKGKWSSEEMEAALALATINKRVTRIIPIMLADAESIINRYPLQLAKLVHIRWSEDLTQIVDQIKKVVLEIDGMGKSYWLEQTKAAYANNDYINSALYSKRAIEYDSHDYAACMYFIASLLQLGNTTDAFRFIDDNNKVWANTEKARIEEQVLDFAQERISTIVTGDEIDNFHWRSSIIDFLNNTQIMAKTWKYYVVLFSKPRFKVLQADIVKYIGFMGRVNALDWLCDEATTVDAEVKQSTITMISMIGYRHPRVKERVVAKLREFLGDEDEHVRAYSLLVYYTLAQDGGEAAVAALHDQSPEVRECAFELLSSSSKFIVTNDWEIEQRKTKKPDPLLTPDLIMMLLKDPDEDVFQDVLDKISDGEIPCPKGFDPFKLDKPQNYEIRQNRVRLLAQNGNEESLKKIIDIAMNDPDEYVREEAVENLKDTELPVPSMVLRDLYKKESVSAVKKELADLILEKGDDSLVDLYYKILTKQMHSEWEGKEALSRIIDSGNRDYISKSLKLCHKHEKQEILAEQLFRLIREGFKDEAVKIVTWCFNNLSELPRALIAAGLLPTIPEQKILDFVKAEDYLVKINAWRALAKRTGDNKYISEINNACNDLFAKVSDLDPNPHWAFLAAIDGVLEFGSKQMAINMLKEYFTKAITENWKKYYPMRAAWERLRALGILIPHTIYEKDKPIPPSPWPDREGTMYIKVRELI